MSDKPFYKLSNPEFSPWLKNFIEVVTANQADLPITAAQIASLTSRSTGHDTKLNAQTAAEEASQAATRDLNDDREISNDEVGYFSTIFKADKTIPRELLLQMGLQVSEGRTSPPPNVPLDLTVTPSASGVNVLKWKRNDNKKMTVFIVEAQEEGKDWVVIGGVTETTFEHKNVTPGVQIAYRVKATRDKRESEYSTPAVAYFKG
jgi:hypothetical protein